MYRSLISATFAVLTLAPIAASSQDAPATEPAVSAGEGQTGTIVFFREKKFKGAAVRYKVRENGTELCKLANGTFCTVQAAAGKHTYMVHSEAKDALTLEVDPGETYYVIGGISMGILAGHPHLTPSTKEAFEGMKDKLKDNTGKDLGGPDEK